ncbi:MAG: TonB-dependent receptor [Bacteroidota bacterium]|nr:TonB-dependent receptor [Bacteroidota bacterium]
MKIAARINLILLTTLSFLLITLSTIQAQHQGMKNSDRTLTVTGIVKDGNADKFIEYARIALFALPDSNLVTGTITNAEGKFIINKLKRGRYYIEVDFIGYRKQRLPLPRPQRGRPIINIGEITLRQAIEEIDEVVVSGERNYIDYKIDKKVINVSQNTNAAGGSAVDALENAPSIQVNIDGDVSLRGSSSFTVLIDGKPTILDANDVLKQTPADMIKTIEIITNPSVKYDPEGTSGIINIIMKNNQKSGLNGIINLNAATWDKYGGDFTLNYRKNKFNYFVSGSYREYPMTGESESYRETFLEDTIIYLTEVSDRARTMSPYRFKAGFDYNINDNTTFSFSGTYGSWNMLRQLETQYHQYYSADLAPESFTYAENGFDIGGTYYSANAFWQSKFNAEGHQLDINLKAWKWNGGRNEYSNEIVSEVEYSPEETIPWEIQSRSSQDEPKNNAALKIDYSLPLSFGKLETGVDIKTSNQESGYTYEDYNQDTKEWIVSNTYSNKYEFYRNLYAGYAQFSGEIIGLGYKAGMRLEYSDRNTKELTNNESFPLELFNYYPSIHLSKKLGKSQEFQLSYSKRIKRPRSWQLNPFPGISDSYSIFKGNPLLEPEDIDAMEFNYLNRLGSQLMFSAGLFYRRVTNKQTRVLSVDPDNPQVNIMTFDNIDNSYSYGAEYMFNYRPIKILNFNISGNIYNYEIETDNFGEAYSAETVTWDFRANTSVNITESTRVQINGMYRSPSVTGQGTIDEMFYVGAAIKQSFLKKKINLSLSVRDLFDSGAHNYEITNSDFHITSMRKRHGQIFRLSFSYKINNYKKERRDDVQPDVGG